MGKVFPSDEEQPISFPDWKEALRQLPAEQRAGMTAHLLDFLRHCKLARAPVTVARVKQYLAAGCHDAARPTLRWFCSGGHVRPASLPTVPEPAAPVLRPAAPVLRPAAPTAPVSTLRRTTTPPPANQDRGGADWERDLITASRRRGLLWRTEEAYRGWAARFARHIAPRSPYAAEAGDIGRFLTFLAVTQRASVATQKQALNALVFLLQEALKRQVGKIDYRRSEAGKKVPTVLSREECRRLFAELRDTTRLMAELAYGSGLRLLELLRLRIHHVDIARQQLQVYDGKGAKHRLTVLPAKVVPALAAHIERLRRLFAEDRAAGLPGVWLPEGLAQKYRRAGEQWEWQWVFVSTARRREHPLRSPLRCAAGPALDANRGLSISALSRSVPRARRRSIRRRVSGGDTMSPTVRFSERSRVRRPRRRSTSA